MSALEEYRKLTTEIETQYVMEYADAAIAELEDALAERERMLRLACVELEEWSQDSHDQSGDGLTAPTPDEWFADLRARAKEEIDT